jgi:DNA-binding transcriptional MerR regulator
MHHFSIRDVENLSGIKAHTLRIWEQRYGLCLCKRKESQHRYYDNEDIKQVLRIAYLYHNGYKISRIAGLTQEQLLQLASKRTGADEYDIFVNQLLMSSMEYDEAGFEQILNHLTLTMGLEKCMVKVIYPLLDKIGLLWMTNHILPAHEHFSSQLIQKNIISAIGKAGQVDTNAGNHFVLFTPEGEQHVIPLLFAQYLLKKQGVKTTLFGAAIPVALLKYYAARQSFTHLYFHAITHLANCEMDEYIRRLATEFPSKKIIVSGPAAGGAGCTKEQPANVTILRSVKEMIDFTKTV